MEERNATMAAEAARSRRGGLAAGMILLSVASGGAGCSTQEEGGEDPRRVPDAGIDGGEPRLGVRIRSPATDRCLTVITEPTVNNEESCPDGCLTAVIGELFPMLTGCSTTDPGQRWDLLPEGGNDYSIRSVGATQAVGIDICLTLGVPEAGAMPTLDPCDQSYSQIWSVVATPGPPVGVRISLGGVYLQAGAPGPSVVMADGPGGPLQVWRIVP